MASYEIIVVEHRWGKPKLRTTDLSEAQQGFHQWVRWAKSHRLDGLVELRHGEE